MHTSIYMLGKQVYNYVYDSELSTMCSYFHVYACHENNQMLQVVSVVL